MHLIIFTHPQFLGSQSMPRYAKMIADGLTARGHTVEIWTARKFFYSLHLPFKKWLGYIDQFVVFPFQVKRRIRRLPMETLFIFSDHGLGPWVQLVEQRPHIIHCHDFLAQRSEQEELPENKLRFSGKIYQRWIRSGFQKGQHFISISNNTREDLHRFLGFSPKLSEVVYNGLNQNFKPGAKTKARKKLKAQWKLDLTKGFILHVGGNQFYKNRTGVIKIYEAWRVETDTALPLILIGPKPSKELITTREKADYRSDIHFLTNISDEALRSSYRGASVLLFPSLEEGFGWPIAEAMASGCPVITTCKAPMTEVGKESCFYIPRMPENVGRHKEWAKECGKILERVVNLPEKDRHQIVASGIENAKRFNTQLSVENIELIYEKVLNTASI